MTTRTITTAAVTALLLMPGTGVMAAPHALSHGAGRVGGLGTVTHQVMPDGSMSTSSLDRSGMALEAFDPRRPGTLLDAARALAGLQEEDATTMSQDVAVDEEDAVPSTYRYMDVVGDLDGDGIADTVVTTTTFTREGSTSQVQARRGSDGGLLWEGEGFGGAFASSIGDVDDDGIGDLLLVGMDVTEAEYSDDCDDDSCTFSADVQLTWTVGVADGATGDVRWSTSQDGRYAYDESYDYGSDVYTSATEGTNVLAGAESLDAAGNGRLLWNVLDVSAASSSSTQDPTGTGLGLVRTSEERSRVRSSTQADVLSAADGSILVTRRTDDVAGVSLLQVAGQMVGDATPDVLWTTQESTDAERDCTAVLGLEDCQGERSVVSEVVEVIDGRDLRAAWTARLPEDTTAFVFGLGSDLDGDDSVDLMALTTTEDEPDLIGLPSFEYATTMLSGATGDVVWSIQESDWLFPLAIDDLRGDGGLDLLTALVEFDGERPLVRLLRVDGDTGAVLLETTAPQGPAPDPDAQCVFGFGYVGGMDDADGDGRSDLFGGDITVSSDDCTSEDTVSHLLWGESGDDGSAVYTAGGEGLRYGFPLGDLDGDGLTDLLVETLVSEEELRSTATAVALPELSALWTTTLEGFSYLRSVPDVDGDGLTDVVADIDDNRFDEEGRPVSFGNVLRVMRGTDGEVLWAAPGVPTIYSRARD